MAQNQNIKDMNLFKKYKTFDEVLVPFLEGKKIEVSPKTLSAYKGKTKVFSEWLQANGLSNTPLRKLSNNDYIRFFHECLIGEHKLDRPTVKKYFQSIRAVIYYAIDVEEVEFMPTFKGLKFPKKGKDCSAQLVPEDKLPDLCVDMYNNDPQLYLAWCMEYYCGVRPRKEARLIKAGAFNLKDGVVKIDASIAKTGRQRQITMADDLVELCKQYGIEKADPDMYVFGKNHSLDVKPVSINMLTYRFNQFRTKHGLPTGVKLYTGKHQGASYLIKIADLKTIQDHLGHSNITSTQHYVKRLSCAVNENIKHNFHNPRTKVNQP